MRCALSLLLFASCRVPACSLLLHHNSQAEQSSETMRSNAVGNASFNIEARIHPLTQNDFDEAEALTNLSSTLKSRLGRVQKQVIYFFGDSLIRNQFMGLCGLVNSNRVPDLELEQGGFPHCDTKEVYGLFFYLEDFRFFTGGLVKKAISEGHPVPSIVYLHVGTHLLHLHPARAMTPDMFNNLNDYSWLLQDVLKDFRKAAPMAQLNVMTTFSLCENMYEGDWLRIARKSISNPSVAAQPCATAMEQRHIQKDVAQDVCEQTFFTRAGSWYIRESVLEAVSNLEGWSGALPIVADMWKLTDGHCDLCDDGRHYNRMVLSQLSTFLTANRL
mmetsp:Transcript_98051/g.255541  ORF Transcript_98051/g.255541 Transcript_98051/m.255541 type:complete len:331 (+) Transcript_98051:76-1068(+)